MPAHRAVIVPIPPEVDADLADVRRRSDPQFNSVPSHLTLDFPHRVRSDALLRHVNSVAGFYRPFRVHLTGFAGSQNAWLFARVTRGNDHLIALHDDLYKGMLAAALDRTSIFVPHVTVGRVNGASALGAALTQSTRTWPGSSKCRRSRSIALAMLVPARSKPPYRSPPARLFEC